MDTFERNAVRSLVTSYAAYLEALNAGDTMRLMSWGKALIEAQRASGIEMLPTVTLLYPLTGDDSAVRKHVNDERWVEAMANELTSVPDTPADDTGPSKLGVISAAPLPRKSSPGAANALGQAAATYFANRR